MTIFILAHESIIRLAFFFGILFLMAINKGAEDHGRKPVGIYLGTTRPATTSNYFKDLALVQQPEHRPY